MSETKLPERIWLDDNGISWDEHSRRAHDKPDPLTRSVEYVRADLISSSALNAREAAIEIVPQCLSRTCFIKDCDYETCWGCDDQRAERARVEAIISKHCGAEEGK
jgi:hypothetical protein